MHNTFLPYLLAIALINSCIELEISAPGFPDMVKQLKTSDASVGLTIIYNLVGFCLASLIYGPLSECFGRRKIMVWGNAILVIGAIGCVGAPTIEWLLGLRFIQGLGAATSAVLVSAIIADVYNTQKATKIYGFMNALFTTLMAISPVIGGFINTIIGWRGNYAVVALISIISWILLFFYLPETSSRKDPLNFKTNLKSYKILLCRLSFLGAAIVPSLLYGCYMSFVALAPFLYMQSYNLSILAYTFHQGVVVAAYALASMLIGKITHLLGNRRALYMSVIVCMLGLGAMVYVTNIYALTITMSLFCVGSAILYPIIFTYSMEIFPHLKGTASSFIMSMRYLLCANLTGIANFFYDGTIKSLAVVLFSILIIIFLLTFYLLKKNKFTNGS